MFNFCYIGILVSVKSEAAACLCILIRDERCYEKLNSLRRLLINLLLNNWHEKVFTNR